MASWAGLSSQSKCQQCGALLPVRSGDEGIVRCEYCGAEARVAVPRPPEREPAPRSPRARPRRNPQGKAARAESHRFWLAAIALVVGGAVVYFVVYSVDQRHEPSSHRFGLRNMPQDRTGWFELDLGDLDVTPSKQDAIANYAWVKRLAHAWSPDAVLTWLETPVRADGFALDAPLISYKFISPARARARAELGGIGGQGAPNAGLMINVVGDTARAMISPHAQGVAETPEVSLACSFKDLMAAAVAEGGEAISKQPVHKLLLDYQVGQWAWRVSFSKVWLDPASCAPVESPFARAQRQ